MSGYLEVKGDFSKQVDQGDNWGKYMGYKGNSPTY